MTCLWRCLFGWMLLFLSVQGYAADTSLILTEAFTASSRASSYITQYVDILEDAGGKLTLAEVTSPVYDGNFTRNHLSELDLHFTRSAYWLRIRLLNRTPVNDWYLSLPGSLARQSELYVYAGSALQPFQQPTLPHFKESVYHLPLAQDTAYTLYLRIQDVQAPLLISLNLHTSTQILQQVVREYPLLSFVIGGLITLALYNLMYFLYLRESSFLALSITILTFILTLGNHLGILQYVGIAKEYFLPFSAAIAFVCLASATSFGASILNIRQNLPQVYPVFRGYFWLDCVLAPVAYFLPYNIVLIGGLGLMMITTVFISFILIQRRGITLSSSLTLASLIALGSVLPALLRAMGVIGDW